MATRRELRARNQTEERYSLSQLGQWINAGGGMSFQSGLNLTYGNRGGQVLADDFESYSDIYKSNGIVAACMAVRESIFSEVRFRFQGINNGRPGRLFGTSELQVLERPWPNGTTGELAIRMIQDVDLAGNFYAVLRDGRLWRRQPDKMIILLSGNPSEDEYVSVAGYMYYPDGPKPGGKFVTYMPEDVCHWTPKPDPQAEYRGMSWLTPILREIRADNAATDHKAEFFDNAATPQMVVKTPPDVMTQEQFDSFRERMQQAHTGPGNRNKTLYLVPGSDVTVVGRDFQQLDFSETQGRDETRIAAAAGVPAVIVGLKESMQGSSLNAGNYGQARRRFADGTMRPLYRSAAAALEALVRPPTANGPARLWYDDSDIAFFREDRKDAADIQSTKAQTIKALVDAGYEPQSVVQAVEAENPSLLVHSGLYSVQLQPAGAQTPPAA